MNEQIHSYFISIIVKTASCLIEKTSLLSPLVKYIVVDDVGSPRVLCLQRGPVFPASQCIPCLPSAFSWASGSISTTVIPESPEGSTKHISLHFAEKKTNNFCLPPRKGLINVCTFPQQHYSLCTILMSAYFQRLHPTLGDLKALGLCILCRISLSRPNA